MSWCSRFGGEWERVAIHLDPADPSASALRGYFAEVWASLDAHPRPLRLSVHTANDRHADVSVAMEEGEPVFRVEGRRAARANFRGRWLAEHPSPLVFSARRATRLLLLPTTGNRVKVRRARLEGWLGALASRVGLSV